MGATVAGLLHGDKVIPVIIGVSDLVVAGGAHLCLPHQAPGEVVIIGNDPLFPTVRDGAGLQAGDPGQIALSSLLLWSSGQQTATHNIVHQSSKPNGISV